MRRIAFVATGATAAFAVHTPAQASLAEGVRVVAGAETAMVRRNHFMPWKPVGSSGHVPALAEVSCEASCTVAVDAENTVVLTPGAVLAVGEYFFVPLVPDAQRLVPAHQVELRAGMAEVISPSVRSIPLVVTVGPNEHVAMRGARVQIAHRADHTAVGVMAGTARAGASRSWITLDTNQSTILPSSGRPRTPAPTVEPPQWTTALACDPAPVAIKAEGQNANVGVCWEPAARGVSYRVELASDPEFRQRLGAIESTEARSFAKVLGTGRYFVRVRSVDADGLASTPSITRKLAVVRLGFPPGSSTNPATRQMVVPEGRDIMFDDADDLEVAVDQGGFFKAPHALRMDAAPSHDLRVRLKEDPRSFSVIRIMRRALRADVRITPRWASWPKDPVDIAVVIEDPTGQTDAGSVKPEFKVLLGLTELHLDWTHRGATWNAHVTPRRVGGPTVLRVIATDEHGTPLGRSFLEIDGALPRGAVVTAPE